MDIIKKITELLFLSNRKKDNKIRSLNTTKSVGAFQYFSLISLVAPNNYNVPKVIVK